MLYVYYGNEVTRVRQKAFDFLHTLTDSDALVTKITADSYQKGVLADLSESVSLFATAQVIVVDTLSEDSDAFTELMDTLLGMSESSNIFIVIEGVLKVADTREMQAYATKMEEIDETKKEKFNVFLLCDALLRRDKKSLWLLLMEAWRNGASNEEIIGMLFWQIKILRLAEKTKTAEEAGQKPFVYQKAKRALASFKKGEIDTMSRALLTMYHDGHLGKCDMSIELEKWVLGV